MRCELAERAQQELWAVCKACSFAITKGTYTGTGNVQCGRRPLGEKKRVNYTYNIIELRQAVH